MDISRMLALSPYGIPANAIPSTFSDLLVGRHRLWWDLEHIYFGPVESNRSKEAPAKAFHADATEDIDVVIGCIGFIGQMLRVANRPFRGFTITQYGTQFKRHTRRTMLHRSPCHVFRRRTNFNLSLKVQLDVEMRA